MSISSLTGVSSGSVTSMTRQREGSLSIAMTSVACRRTGPTRTASRRPRGEMRNLTAWPAAGASTMSRSATPDCSSCFTLPSTRMSRMPGTAVATTSIAPELTRRRESRRMPRSPRYSSNARSGESVRARTPGASSPSSYSSGARPKHAGSPDLPSTSTMSTLAPVRAAATARAALTVVFPTPPLPATMTTRDIETNAGSSIDRMLREAR